MLKWNKFTVIQAYIFLWNFTICPDTDFYCDFKNNADLGLTSYHILRKSYKPQMMRFAHRERLMTTPLLSFVDETNFLFTSADFFSLFLIVSFQHIAYQIK